jgi:hypothetical protein
MTTRDAINMSTPMTYIAIGTKNAARKRKSKSGLGTVTSFVYREGKPRAAVQAARTLRITGTFANEDPNGELECGRFRGAA